MHEVDKLRKRLKSFTKNATEYRMSIADAKALLAEIDKEIVKTKVVEVIPKEIENDIIYKVIDGGDFSIG